MMTSSGGVIQEAQGHYHERATSGKEVSIPKVPRSSEEESGKKRSLPQDGGGVEYRYVHIINALSLLVLIDCMTSFISAC